MKTCNCTLGPEACASCLTVDYNDYYQDGPYTIPATYYPTKTIKRTTKTIEKYGPNGEYLGKEVITTDKEDILIQDWGSTGTGAIDSGITFVDNDTTLYWCAN
jgi:hypothetical protein